MKAILVGLGGRGRHWVRVCRDFGTVELVAYVEPAANIRKLAITELAIAENTIHASLAEAIKAHKADFVIDVTPPAAHETVALAAFENGLHVLGEKPISSSVAVARRMIEASRRAGRRHMITQNYRFGAVPRTTRRLINDGIIGKPGQLDVTFYMPWADMAGSHYVTEPYMFLNDMCIHHFDMMRYILGADPASVHCITWNHPWGWHKGDACHVAHFGFSDGLHATHTGLGCSVGKTTSWNGNWRLEGPQGSLSWEADKIIVVQGHRTEKKVNGEQPLDQLPYVGEKAILAEFLKALKENREPECSGEDNLKSLSMALAAIKSAQEKREVRLAELG